MTFGGLVKRDPEGQPNKSERSSGDERRAPTIRETQPNDQRWRDDRSHRGATVEDRHAEGAFANRKPFGDSFGSARPVPCFTQTEHKSKCAEACQAPRERMGHRRDRPYYDRINETQFRPDSIVQLSRQSLADRISEQKP